MIENQKRECSEIVNEITKFTCKNGNKATLLCSSQACLKNAFICRNEQCQCMFEQHRRCDYTATEPLLSTIISKKGVIPEEVQKAIAAVQKIYEQSIDKLSIDREHLIYWRQNYGVSVQQAQFLDYFKSGQRQSVTGQVVFKIKSQIDSTQNVDWFTQNWVDTFWDKQRPIFERIFAKINQLGHSESMKKRYFDSCITYDIMKIKSYFDEPVASFQLLYRATQHEFCIEKFYQHCSDIPHTMVLIHTQFDKIIGGYTPLVWKKPAKQQYIKDPSKKSFIFSLTNDQKFPLIRESDAIKYQTTWGPIFGGGNGWDMSIPDRKSNTSGGIFNFPASYNNGKYSSNQAGHQALSGTTNGYYSQIKQWEVFKVVFKGTQKSS